MDTSHFKTPDSLYLRIHELFSLIIKNVKEHNVKESENKNGNLFSIFSCNPAGEIMNSLVQISISICFRLLECLLPRTAPWSRKRSETLKSWWRRPRGTERRWRSSGRSYGKESWSSSRERCAKSAPRNEEDSRITSCFTVAPHQVASRETERQEAPKMNPEGRLLSSSLVLRGGATHPAVGHRGVTFSPSKLNQIEQLDDRMLPRASVYTCPVFLAILRIYSVLFIFAVYCCKWGFIYSSPESVCDSAPHPQSRLCWPTTAPLDMTTVYMYSVQHIY